MLCVLSAWVRFHNDLAQTICQPQHCKLSQQESVCTTWPPLCLRGSKFPSLRRAHAHQRHLPRFSAALHLQMSREIHRLLPTHVQPLKCKSDTKSHDKLHHSSHPKRMPCCATWCSACSPWGKDKAGLQSLRACRGDQDNSAESGACSVRLGTNTTGLASSHLCACRWVYKLMPADKTPLTSQQEAELFELAFRMAPTPQRVPWSRIVRSSSFRGKRCEQ